MLLAVLPDLGCLPWHVLIKKGFRRCFELWGRSPDFLQVLVQFQQTLPVDADRLLSRLRPRAQDPLEIRCRLKSPCGRSGILPLQARRVALQSTEGKMRPIR